MKGGAAEAPPADKLCAFSNRCHASKLQGQVCCMDSCISTILFVPRFAGACSRRELLRSSEVCQSRHTCDGAGETLVHERLSIKSHLPGLWVARLFPHMIAPTSNPPVRQGCRVCPSCAPCQG